MDLKQYKWYVDLSEVTLSHWLRIVGCFIFTYFMFRLVLTRIIAIESMRFALDIYNVAKTFEQVNKSSELVTSAMFDSYLFVLAFYWIATIVIVIAVIRWFGLPDKIFNKTKL